MGRRFAAAGCSVALLARNAQNLSALRAALPTAYTHACDVTRGDHVSEAFAMIRRNCGPVSTLIYNAGAGAFGSIDDTSPEQFEAAWRVNALGCLHCVKAVLPDMRSAGGGNIVITGATASKRGGANFAAFSSAKGAQYNLAQSLARHLGPEQIHVAYVVIDGVIDLPRTRARMPEQPDEFFLNPDHIADVVFGLTRQHRSAWTFEVDVRPFGEKW